MRIQVGWMVLLNVFQFLNCSSYVFLLCYGLYFWQNMVIYSDVDCFVRLIMWVSPVTSFTNTGLLSKDYFELYFVYPTIYVTECTYLRYNHHILTEYPSSLNWIDSDKARYMHIYKKNSICLSVANKNIKSSQTLVTAFKHRES